jgi:hypothetical protein
MQLELFDFEEDEIKVYEVPKLPEDFLMNFTERNMSDSALKRAIDNLALTADQKAMISRISSFSINVGQVILSIGRKILELSLLFFKKFPATSFGLVIGLVVSSFIPAGNIRGWAVPVISSLSALAKKIIVLFAIGLGMREDLRNTTLGNTISVATANIRNSMEIN